MKEPIMKKIFLILTLVSIVFPPLAFSGETNFASIEWAPYVGKSLEKNGFITEIVEAAWKRSGHKLAVKFLPAKRAMAYTQKGRYVAMFPFLTDKRGQGTDFLLSEPFAGSTLVFYKRKADKPIMYKSLNDLKPYKIGVVRGFSYTSEFDKADYLQKDAANSETSNFLKLEKKRIDLVIADKYVADKLFRRELSRIAPQIEQVYPPFSVQPMYVAFSKSIPGAKEMVGEFNTGLRNIKRDGTLNEIMEKHGYSTISSQSFSRDELKDFIEDGLQYIQKVGLEKAFEEFNKPDGMFSRGDLYIFAINMEGDILAHVNPKMVGKNRYKLKDKLGFPFVQEFIKIAKTKGAGWSEYWWPNPITKKMQPKITYIKSVNDNVFVGCGIYKSVGPNELKGFIESAAQYIRKAGLEKAVEEFKNPDGMFSEGELYIFVVTLEGETLAHVNPKLVGKNNYALKDKLGFAFVQEFIKVAKTRGSGWVEYWWENPINKKIQPKISFIKRIENNMFIGCGIYK